MRKSPGPAHQLVRKFKRMTRKGKIALSPDNMVGGRVAGTSPFAAFRKQSIGQAKGSAALGVGFRKYSAIELKKSKSSTPNNGKLSKSKTSRDKTPL